MSHVQKPQTLLTLQHPQASVVKVPLLQQRGSSQGYSPHGGQERAEEGPTKDPRRITQTTAKPSMAVGPLAEEGIIL